jgi:hypothetical protein
MFYDMIHWLTAFGLSPGGSTHLHTNNTQNNTNNNWTTQIQAKVEECGSCPVFPIFIVAFALQMRKKHEKISVRVRRTSVTVQYTYYQKHPPITKPSQTHTLQKPLIHTHTLARAHTHTQTHTHTYIHTHTYTHITKQYKTTTVQIKTKCI